MTTKTIKIPDASHPITVEPSKTHVTISVAGKVIADTKDALTLRESTYPAVLYIPRKEVDMSLLERTDLSTYGPNKGDAPYYSVPQIGGDKAANAVWTYEQPYEPVAEIKDHLAFYADRVEIAEEPVA